ncbi:MAG: glycosyltransferase family 4 protein [Saprospiraceae bacterium]|nr:glycosyltransferase family 4 protein [Saprospiraceae bacterium]
MTELAFFSRKKTKGAFSIGQIFESLAKALAEQRPVAEWELPHPTNSIWNLLGNIAAARRNAINGVNHITGDAHYVVLGINRGRTVLTVHDCILLARTPRHPLKYHLYKWLWYKWPIRKADVITAISEKSKEEIVRYTGCSPEKIKVIPNCVNPIYRYSPQPFGADVPRILHIGTAPHKNLPRVVAALKGINCVLEIVGHLNTEQQAMLAASGVRYENRFNLSLKALAERYRAADLVVFASLYEGFGMPIIEAQATGRPVVTSNIEPMTWVAGEGGACFVNPTDVQSIRTGILKVLYDADFREKLVRQGLENVRRFSVEQIASQYAKVYDSLYPKVPKTVRETYSIV